MIPQPAQDAQRRGRRLADDEAVRHVLHARCGGGADAERAALTSEIRIAAAIGGGASGTSSRKSRRWRATSSRDAACRDDVDEPEQRGAQVAVARRKIHRTRIERSQRVARAGGERVGELRCRFGGCRPRAGRADFAAPLLIEPLDSVTEGC